MYQTLLGIHSLFRWLVVISLLYTIYRASKGWHFGKPFLKLDNFVRHTTATIAHIQLILGIWLYFISPVVDYFLHNFSDAVHLREIRFFGMEHSLMMFVAIVIITIGSAKAKRKPTDKEKFKTMVIWFSIALFIIVLNVPWKFSPLISRPYFRTF
jgi:hypothetical protein